MYFLVSFLVDALKMFYDHFFGIAQLTITSSKPATETLTKKNTDNKNTFEQANVNWVSDNSHS